MTGIFIERALWQSTDLDLLQIHHQNSDTVPHTLQPWIHSAHSAFLGWSSRPERSKKTYTSMACLKLATVMKLSAGSEESEPYNILQNLSTTSEGESHVCSSARNTPVGICTRSLLGKVSLPCVDLSPIVTEERAVRLLQASNVCHIRYFVKQLCLPSSEPRNPKRPAYSTQISCTAFLSERSRHCQPCKVHC